MKKISLLLTIIILLSGCSLTNNQEQEPEKELQIEETSKIIEKHLLHEGGYIHTFFDFVLDPNSNPHYIIFDERGGNDCPPEIYNGTYTGDGFKPSSFDEDISTIFNGCELNLRFGEPCISTVQNQTSHIACLYDKQDSEKSGLLYLKYKNHRYYSIDNLEITNKNLSKAFIMEDDKVRGVNIETDSKNNPHIIWGSIIHYPKYCLSYIWWNGEEWKNYKGEDIDLGNKNWVVGDITIEGSALLTSISKNDSMYVANEVFDRKLELDFLEVIRLKDGAISILDTSDIYKERIIDPTFTVTKKGEFIFTWNNYKKSYFCRFDGETWRNYKNLEIKDPTGDAMLPILGTTFVDGDGVLHVLKGEHYIYLRWDGFVWTNINGEVVDPIEYYSALIPDEKKASPYSTKFAVEESGDIHILSTASNSGFGFGLYYISVK